jgi:Arc/MetJ-type ribon-helix-helix transcriptional regulator
MQLKSIKPEVANFIEQQVRAGRFASEEALVEAAVEQMMQIDQAMELGEEDVSVINESDAQIDRGEFVEFSAFAAEMRRKYGGA